MPLIFVPKITRFGRDAEGNLAFKLVADSEREGDTSFTVVIPLKNADAWINDLITCHAENKAEGPMTDAQMTQYEPLSEGEHIRKSESAFADPAKKLSTMPKTALALEGIGIGIARVKDPEGAQFLMRVQSGVLDLTFVLDPQQAMDMASALADLPDLVKISDEKLKAASVVDGDVSVLKQGSIAELVRSVRN